MPDWIATVPKNILQECHRKYRDTEYDISIPKAYMINIIKFVFGRYSNNDVYYDIDNCKLNLCSIYGLKINIKGNEDVTFLFCIKTGHVYCSVSQDSYF